MIIDVKTALEGCGEKCKAFVPVVALSTWETDHVKRWYRCEHYTKCRALADTIRRTMADNVNEAIKDSPDYCERAKTQAEFWESIDKWEEGK